MRASHGGFARALAAVLVAGTASLPALAQSSASVDRFYVFGDSYSDGGNIYALTKKPVSPPYDRRYSNGMTAIEYMARAFGITLRYSEEPDLAADASLNFAVSGAWTSTKNNDAPIDGRTGLLSQIGSFEQRLKNAKLRFNADTTLFFIAIGTNDVLFGNIAGQDSATLVASAVQNVERAVRSLHAAGARHIAIALIPMVNLAPRAASLPPATVKAVGEAVAAVNQGYQRIAGRLRTDLKADVFTLPWGPYYDALMASPSAFGMTNAGSCIGQGTAVCPEPHRVVFWDMLHPTTAAHCLVGYRLAVQGWPHFACPADLKPGAASDTRACRFLSAANGEFTEHPGPVVAAAPPAAPTCSRLAFRQMADMCNGCTAPPWNGELNRAAGDEWTVTFVDGHNKPGRGLWRATLQTSAEIAFYDKGRDTHTRFDLAARKGRQSRGVTGNWITTSEILGTDCR